MGLKGSCPSVTARPGTRCLKLSLAPPYKKGNKGIPRRRDGRPGSLVFSQVTRGPVVRGRSLPGPESVPGVARCQNLEPKRLPLSVTQEPPVPGSPQSPRVPVFAQQHPGACRPV